MVDIADLPIVEPLTWFALSNRRDGRASVTYAVATVDNRTVGMHRLITGASSQYLVDHEDGDGLNNTRSNLRVATRSQNGANSRSRGGSSRFKGVLWDKSRKLWRVEITINRKSIHLGRFADEVEAAKAYDDAARAAWGEFARLNLSG